MYWGGPAFRSTLRGLVQCVCDGTMHPGVADVIGDLKLVGIEKPDGGTRPIGIGGAIRRLAGRCVMHDSGERMGRVFTETRPTEAMLQAAGHGGRECNIPLQVGVGIKGGAEIAVAVVQLALQRHRDWAVFSDDKSNAFNTVTREAIYRGLKEWFPELIPTFRLFYARSGKLFSVGKAGRQLATDEDGLPYSSTEGCTQGDPLGPFYWAVGYHFTLLEVQARHPDVTMLAFLDDTYYLQEPLQGLAAMRTGAEVTEARTKVKSNLGKQEVYGGPACDLSPMPAALRGAPTAPPDPDKGYAGGRLVSVKVLGAFLGGVLECSEKLVARVERKLKALEQVPKLRDTTKCNVALQVAMQINRFCANTSLNYFMRTMGSAATRAAAARHDALVEECLFRMLGSTSATATERSRAIQQARLPVKLGGLGITSMQATQDSAVVGKWALCFWQMRRLCPQIFAHVDLATCPLPAAQECRSAHKRLQDKWRRMDATWREVDTSYYDYDKFGEGHAAYRPPHLPGQHKLEPITAYCHSSKFHFGQFYLHRCRVGL